MSSSLGCNSKTWDVLKCGYAQTFMSYEICMKYMSCVINIIKVACRPWKTKNIANCELRMLSGVTLNCQMSGHNDCHEHKFST